MSEQNNERRKNRRFQIKQQAKRRMQKQIYQQLKQKAKEQIKKKLAEMVAKKVVVASFTTPPFVGWIVAGIVIILIAIMTMIFVVMGESSAQASEAHKPVYETTETHQAYLDLEAQSYTTDNDGEPDTNGDDRAKDEYAYRLPWAVMSQLDTYFYKGQATTEERQEIFNTLKSTYSGDRTDNDTYIKYKAKAVYRTESDGNGGTIEVFDHWEWEKDTEKQVKRHIIPQAVTWEGTFTRSYTKVHIDGRILKPRPADGNDTVQESYIWQYEDKEATIDHKRLIDFIRVKDPSVWDSQISMTLGIIDILIQQDPLDTGLDRSGADYSYNGPIIQGEFTWPVPQTGLNGVTCPYGPRIHPITKKESFHYGVDIGGGLGYQIVAARDGVVAYEGVMESIEGNNIKLDHGKDSQGRRVFTRYLHLSKFLVGPGETVKAGQPIGLMGSTGWSTGPHLHFEINIDGNPVDPIQFFHASQSGTNYNSSEVAKEIQDAVQTASQKYDVSSALIMAIIKAESGFNPNATSGVGAQGLMQLMPDTASGLGITDSYNIQQNVDAGTRYIKALLNRFSGDLKLAIAAYNAGPGNVEAYHGIPPFPETQNYVQKVLAYYTGYSVN